MNNSVTRNKLQLNKWIKRAWPSVILPLVVLFLFHNREIHPGYDVSWWKLYKLARRLRRNGKSIKSGSSYRAHLAMAAKLLEISPATEGVVVECGCFKGGSTANLSIICDFVGRDLIIYDSFEGLPIGGSNDRYARDAQGHFLGALDTVSHNVEEFGVLERCSFRKGWFIDTLPDHVEPIVLAFLDVDYQASIHDCLVNLWPHLIDKGYVFTDDYTYIDLCAVYFSEEFWQREFGTNPPGLIGTGTGIAMGQFFVGPLVSMGGNRAYPLQSPASTAYTRKDYTGYWGYRRENEEKSE